MTHSTCHSWIRTVKIDQKLRLALSIDGGLKDRSTQGLRNNAQARCSNRTAALAAFAYATNVVTRRAPCACTAERHYMIHPGHSSLNIIALLLGNISQPYGVHMCTQDPFTRMYRMLGFLWVCARTIPGAACCLALVSEASRFCLEAPLAGQPTSRAGPHERGVFGVCARVCSRPPGHKSKFNR